MNDLSSILGSLGNRRAGQEMGPILNISTFSTENIIYFIFVPFVVFPQLNYIFICISNYLSWIYMIHICFLGIPKPSSANLASLVFCTYGNYIKSCRNQVLAWCQWNFQDHKLKCGRESVSCINEVTQCLGDHKREKLHIPKSQSYIQIIVFCSP